MHGYTLLPLREKGALSPLKIRGQDRRPIKAIHAAVLETGIIYPYLVATS